DRDGEVDPPSTSPRSPARTNASAVTRAVADRPPHPPIRAVPGHTHRLRGQRPASATPSHPPASDGSTACGCTGPHRPPVRPPGTRRPLWLRSDLVSRYQILTVGPRDLILSHPRAADGPGDAVGPRKSDAWLPRRSPTGDGQGGHLGVADLHPGGIVAG